MKKLACLMAVLLVSSNVFAQETVTVYAAASMTNAVGDLVKAYKSEHKDVTILSVFGGSSSLARQIESGAPADVFLSANEKWVNYLISKQLVDIKNVRLLASNQLVLIKPNGSNQSMFDVNDKQAWKSVLKNDRMAVGNTDAVPVGLYSKEVLMNLGVWDTVKPRLAQTSNVRSALALVERGEAPLGMVYKTDAMLTDNVETLSTFDPSLHTAIHYPLVQITDKPASKALVDFMTSQKAKKILKEYGFRTKLGNEQFAQ